MMVKLRPLNVFNVLMGIIQQVMLVTREFSLQKFQIVRNKLKIKIDVISVNQGLL